MPSRVLETVLTGRNLLSPVLAGAGKDVEAFNVSVTEANAQSAASAETSAVAQETAAAKVVEANTRAADSAKVAGAETTAAQDRAASSAVKSADAQSAASTKVVESNARQRESAMLLADTTDTAALRTAASWQKLATVGLPLVGVAIAAVTGKMAADFQTNMVKLATTAGAGMDQVGALGQGMLDMAGKVGIGAQELSAGMYTVESSLPATETGAKRTADALNILKASAEGARQESADLGKVADAVSTALHDYHLPASDAAQVTSELITAVSHGKTTFDELTGSLHSITPLASVLHVSLADVTGTLSAMTASGMSADQATQNMADTLRHLANPTNTMTAELAQLGITSSDLANDLSTHGLAGTLQLVETAIVDHLDPATQKVLLPALNQSKTAVADMTQMMATMPPALAKASQSLLDGSTNITDYTKSAKGLGGQQGAMALQFESLYKSSDGFNQVLKAGGPAQQAFEAAMAKSFGTASALNVALQTTGENADATNAAIADVAKASGDASGNIKGWGEVQATFNQKLAEAGAGAGALAIELGQHFLPAMTAGLGWVADHGVPALQDLGHWLGEVAQSTTVQATLHGIADAGQVMWTVLKATAGVVGPLASDLGHLFGSLPGPVQAVTLALLAFNVARNAGWLTPGGAAESEASAGIIRRSLTGIGAAATEAAMVTASSFGQMKAAYAEAAAAAQLSASIQEESMASTRIAGAVAGTTAAVKNLAVQGFGAVKAGASGLVGLLGGPFGLAMIGATVGITSVTSALQDQRSAEAQAKQSGQSLADLYNQLGTVYGKQADNARESVLSTADWAQKARDAGVSAETLTQAMQGNVGAQKQVTSSLDSASARWGELTSGQFSLGDVLTDNTGKFKDMAQSAFDGVNGSVTAFDHFNVHITDTGHALADFQTDLKKVFGPNAIPAESPVQKGIDELAKAGGDAKLQLQGVKDILAGLTGQGIQAAQATADLTLQTNTTATAFKDMAKGALDAHGNIALNTQAGAELYKNLQDLGSGFSNVVSEAYAAAGGTANATAANAAAADAAGKLYEKFILTATGAGMSAQAAEDLAKQLGLVPSEQVTTFLQPGMDAARAALDLLAGKIIDIPNDKTIHTSALTQNTIDALKAVGYSVVENASDHTFTITANASIQGAVNDLQGLEARFRSFTINVRATPVPGGFGGALAGPQAIGHVVHAYAAGGLQPMQGGIAQVVHANTWRIIGDRVRDDEFYIPDNQDARSKAIGAEYVRRHPDVAAAALGMGSGASYNPAGTGFTAASSPGYGPAATASGAVIDYARLGQAVAAAMQATGAGRSGALVEMNGVTIGDQSDANQLAERLAHIGRTRGW